MEQSFYKQEITPIATDDCFIVLERTKYEFDFPVHYHSEYELTCIEQGSELTRYIGKHSEKCSNWELALVGPNLIHGWLHEQPLQNTVYEKTLQFHPDLFTQQLLGKNALADLKQLFQEAGDGLLFSPTTAETVFPLLHLLANTNGIKSFILLQQIFLELIQDSNRIVLNSTEETPTNNKQNNALYSYIQKHYHQPIKLEDMADIFNMSVSSFNRMIKKQTGNTFVTFLNEYRLGMAARKLLETEYGIEYIAKSCGFHNLSNFNKFFKRVYKMPPQSYRIVYKGTATVK